MPSGCVDKYFELDNGDVCRFKSAQEIFGDTCHIDHWIFTPTYGRATERRTAVASNRLMVPNVLLATRASKSGQAEIDYIAMFFDRKTGLK